MPYDGSGNFNRNFPAGGWQGDAAAGIKIMADRHDTHDKDLADGLTNCITKDGQSQPLANIPMNGKRIVNMADPVDPDDAATKKFVETITGWSTSKTISGADLNGRLIFSGTGVTGIQWTVADLFWGAKAAKASETTNRLVMNDKADATGTDKFIIDERGALNNNGELTSNLSWDGAAWRAISPGIGTKVTYSGGTFTLSSNDVATITNPYAVATLRNFLTVQNTGPGSTYMTLDKSASGKLNLIFGSMAGKYRWRLDLGNATAETATDRVGSDFYLYSYDNAGTTPFPELWINRATHLATFGGSVASASNFDSVSATCILSATSGGSIYFRPNGPTVSTEEWRIDTLGNFQAQSGIAAAAGGVYAGRGIASKLGYQGGYTAGPVWMNMAYVAPDVRVYVNSSYMGDIYWQVASDYRIKENIQPLASMWDGVKALKPITYTRKAFRDLEADTTEKWGFIAHEMQEALGDLAASGRKDDPEITQAPNQWLLITALTRALQEAMQRIEALEAKA